MAKLTLKKKQIYKKIEQEIAGVEWKIHKWIDVHYGKKMWCSIQLMNEGQNEFRPSPCNNYCEIAYDDLELNKRCDSSDRAMKEILYNSRRDNAITYLCHMKVSNMVIPHYDSQCTKGTFWYIFLGQYLLNSCTTCKCHICDDGFKAENVINLDPQKIEPKYNSFVFPEIMNDTHKDFESFNIDVFTIPELLICKVKATEIFSEFLSNFPYDEDELKKTDMISWVKYNNTLKANGNKEKSPLEIASMYIDRIRDGIVEIKSIHPEKIKKDFDRWNNLYKTSSNELTEIIIENIEIFKKFHRHIDWSSIDDAKIDEFLENLRQADIIFSRKGDRK